MIRTIEEIEADAGGAVWRVPVFRFAARPGADGPSAYLQAALHANEQPGTGVLHSLCAALRRAEAEGRLLGPITVVPAANPIGLNQHLFGQQMGRFDTAAGINYNRGYPLAGVPEPRTPGEGFGTAALKRKLLGFALEAEIVLDLHCDDEAVPYLYLHHALWPGATDLATALGAQAVLLWDGPDGGAAFEEAALAPWLALPAAEAGLARRAVATVELRGRADVSEALAAEDAAGLERFLVVRGTIEGPRPVANAFTGLAASIRQVDMVPAPVSGAIWYHVEPGESVVAGAPLATVLARPGEEDGAVTVRAPSDGFVLTRRAHRYTRAGEDLLKLVVPGQSRTYRPGTLES